MDTKDLKDIPVGKIVAEDYAYSEVFNHYGIDYCCQGDMTLSDACKHAGVNYFTVRKALVNFKPMPGGENIPFDKWPEDLLADYILKIFHRNIRSEGPVILDLLDKVTAKYGGEHPTLFEVQELFNVSLHDLYHHLRKEEDVLFPYIYALCDAKLNGTPMPQFHCGSIANPIEVMKMEHDAEGERYAKITELTGGYEAPSDVDEAYVVVMKKLKEFNDNLHKHIHLENNILFPKAIALQQQLMATAAAY